MTLTNKIGTKVRFPVILVMAFSFLSAKAIALVQAPSVLITPRSLTPIGEQGEGIGK